MADRKPYQKPEIIRIDLDPTITLMMRSAPNNPMMMMTVSDGSKGTDSPFTSPFDNKPFN